jgi:4-oxalmesaconate hydratase
VTVIDAHAHISAPPEVFAFQARLIASGGYPEARPPKLTEQQHRDALAKHLARLDQHGTDLQLLSPRPFHMMHSAQPAKIVGSWTSFVNDVIATHVSLYPKRFRGVAGLPQFRDTSPRNCLSELERCVTQLGFVGALVNPDRLEGMGDVPGLGDEFWFPLYEKFCELDVPLYVHSAGCAKDREPYTLHFINEESTAVISLLDSDVFERFPSLQVVISHGGGAIPYQVGRFRSIRLVYGGEDFDQSLRRLWFDTCLWSREGLELLLKVVGPERVLFGTEVPGTGSGFDQRAGRYLDDMLPLVTGCEFLSPSGKEAILCGNAERLFKLKVRENG